MKKFLSAIKEFILDIIFPSFCIICGKEGNYLCQDCQGLVELSQHQYCPFCSLAKIVFDGKTCSSCKKTKQLSGLYCATNYDNFVVKKLINQFKYQPYLKELSKPCSLLIMNSLALHNCGVRSKCEQAPISSSLTIIAHLFNLNHFPDFNNFILVPIPLHKKKLKERGFNQAEEIGKELSKFLNIPIFNDVLIKIKQTLDQVELKKEERQENIRGVFLCQKPEIIKNKKILLIDDIFTTGSTMEECACVLKDAGAKEIWGMVVARG